MLPWVAQCRCTSQQLCRTEQCAHYGEVWLSAFCTLRISCVVCMATAVHMSVYLLLIPLCTGIPGRAALGILCKLACTQQQVTSVSCLKTVQEYQTSSRQRKLVLQETARGADSALTECIGSQKGHLICHLPCSCPALPLPHSGHLALHFLYSLHTLTVDSVRAGTPSR